ncbi:MAG TPA: hypothetical protein VLW17_06185 [Thermoanaerobaculaceae bacterium]|nr:hypothetical protein [Thermoanaerobaculaceae bacterium]
MQSRAPAVPLLVALALLVVLLYPALVLDARIAPEASLRGVPPWRLVSGPFPKPSPMSIAAATQLGPRLACIAREGLDVALWNPWIGGGRPGWLSAPEEGGAPLPVLAGLTARRGWTWTALVGLEIVAGFLASWWLGRRLGLAPWPAAVAGVAYAISGPVVSHWLDWQGSAHVLGPLAMIPLASPARRLRHQVAAWGSVVLLLLACGLPAVPYLAAALGLAVLSRPVLAARPRWAAIGLGVLLALAAALPGAWLDRAGGEEGAAAPTAQLERAVEGWRGVIAPASLSTRPDDPAAAARSAPDRAYLGAAVVALALIGIVAAPARLRGFWVAVLAVCAVALTLPAATLARLAVRQRPFGLLALAAALLAGFGAAALLRRLSPGRLANGAGAVLCGAVGLTLTGNAVRSLPFVAAEEADLESPAPSRSGALDARLDAILSTLPPDSAASFGLADVRAAWFRREPTYASRLGAGPGGVLSVGRALSPELARLGGRWLLEPQPLHLVSGEVFSRIEQTEMRVDEGRSRDGLRHYLAEVPSGACRIAVRPEAAADGGPWISRPGRRTRLEPDPALAAESDAWRWFSLPDGWPAGPAEIAVREDPATGRSAAVAWDSSRLRLRVESQGARVWEWQAAPRIAFLAAGVEAEGRGLPDDPLACSVPAGRVAPLRAAASFPAAGTVRIVSAAADRIELAAELKAPALLVAEVKYRPRLWSAELGGGKVTTERVDGLWTGVVLPAGSSAVTFRARLPLGLAALSVAALGTLAAMAIGGRRA